MSSYDKCTVGILIFDDVEVLDYCGPFEVFSVAGRLHATGTNQGGTDTTIHVVTIAETDRPTKALGNFQTVPSYSIHNHPPLDLLIIPGGWGVWAALESSALVTWIESVSHHVDITCSVCTGAFLLAKVGMLEGHNVTTHWLSLDRLAQTVPSAHVQQGVRWVDEGKIVTSAGISAGIDMSLHLVERLFGRELAVTTAKRMEYAWE